MKLRWKIAVGIVAASAIGPLLLFSRGSSEQKAVEETRLALRSQGFKTDLSEFNFSTSDQLRARVAALTNAATFTVPTSREEAALRALQQQLAPDLMQPIGGSSAIPVWRLEQLAANAPVASYLQEGGASSDDLWRALRESFNADQELLDAACAAALSGPIRFDLDASKGMHMLLPHLAALKNLTQTLGSRAVLELHDGNNPAAWTNLLACARLVTAYEPEANEISHLVRFPCAVFAFNSTWQLLQADGWSDERLASLQHEWESVDFFKELPETAAFSRASHAAACQLERQQPLGSLGFAVKDVFRSPGQTWANLKYYYGQVRYRHHGSYEDEQALLLHHRDRELELRRAVQSQTWSEMRQLPGVTNAIPFQSKHQSRLQAMLNTRRLSMNFVGQGQGLLGRAADAETRRRLIVNAVALERYRGRHGAYPKTLDELVPAFLKDRPMDFTDGQPLRYQLTDDAHFVLYSVGLDCVDNGGEMRSPAQRGIRYEGVRDFGIPQGTDLVWPRPASAAEIKSFQQEQLKAQQEIAGRDADLQAVEQWRRTAWRQSQVEYILATNLEVRATEPTDRGRSLANMLRNGNAAGTNNFTLNELLTLKQVITGSEPEIITFEAPISYDALTNLGELQLYIDVCEDEESDEGCQVAWLECHRAANGNCLLVWNTIYESPGKHALQMDLELNESTGRGEDCFAGPVTPFVVSNFCQFSLSSAYFNPAFGATLQAKLPELNGAYTVEITSPTGDRLRTMSGSTSNGVIKLHWDLTDDHGNRCTHQAFGTVFHVTLADSGRSQTLKGP